MWLRLHVDLVNNPKIQRLPDRMFRFLINCWCLYRSTGKIPELADLAWQLRCTETAASRAIQELMDAQLLVAVDGVLQPKNWNEHQYQSDVSTARVKRFREKRNNVSRNASETFHETPPDTETEQKQNRTQVSPLPPMGADTRAVVAEFVEREPDFGEFLGAFLAHGRSFSEPEMLKFGRAWVSLERTEQAAAVEWAKAQAMGEWRTRGDPKFIPNPGTVLREKHWTRKPTPRAIAAISRGAQVAEERNRDLTNWAKEGN